jgi:hypothetical protein
MTLATAYLHQDRRHGASPHRLSSLASAAFRLLSREKSSVASVPGLSGVDHESNQTGSRMESYAVTQSRLSKLPRGYQDHWEGECSAESRAAAIYLQAFLNVRILCPIRRC